MRILAIETSGAKGSVAALSGQDLLLELSLHAAQRGAQSLAPALSDLLRQVIWRPKDAQVVGVSVGPGSFTSLRVGVTTAKTFAYAVSAEILAIGTLEVIAAQAEVPCGGLISPMLDAQRGDLYTALYRRHSPFDHELVQPPSIVSTADWLAGVSRETVLIGPALEKLTGGLPAGQRMAPRDSWHPAARTVGRLAAVKYAAGERGDVWSVMPFYLRKSAAEERASGA